MKILLVQNSPFVTHRSWNYLEHLGLGFLEKVLTDQGFPVNVIDATWNWDDAETNAKKVWSRREPYDLIGFSVNRSNFTAPAETLKLLRKRGFKGHVTLGGYFPTFHSEKILQNFPEIDSIILGHGESTLLKLCRRLREDKSPENLPGLAFRSNQGKIKSSPNFETEAFIDTVGIPIHRPRYGVARMITSRGCYWRCSFCCISAFDRYSFKTRQQRRRLDEVLEEVDFLFHHHHVNHIWFSDMEFVGKDKAFVHDFCDHIINKGYEITFEADCRVDSLDEPLIEKLSRAGFAALFLGVESFVDRQTSDYHKFKKNFDKNEIFKVVSMMKKHHITPRFGFIMFDKDTTEEDLELNHQIISSTVGYGSLDSLANKLAVLPGTKIESDYLKDRERCFKVEINEKNRLESHLYYTQYTFKNPRIAFLYEASFQYRNKIIRLQ
ncbi:MAG: B12-binding domain-containing radical SAM protein, partial [Deltaproteobacteria bacterium]|nr:B12-binding domain-containing radical SAM protein [Deltaproteobacteria bacterium]